MKRRMITLLAVFITFVSVGQSPFDGYWAGNFITDEDATVLAFLKITNGEAKALFWDNDDKKFIEGPVVEETTISVRNNLSYSWINQSKIWTETQSFMLTLLRPGTLDAVWVRQVNNMLENKNENESWSVTATGEMNKHTLQEIIKIAKENAK